MKLCTKCHIDRLESDFYKAKAYKNGLRSWCKYCVAVWKKVARKRYRKQHSLYNAKYYKERAAQDPIYKLKHNIRNRINQVLKYTKPMSPIKALGCTLQQLKKHLESQFQEGMSWNNHGEWHVDHIKPLASFNLVDEKEFTKACYYTNLQPLWANENLIKGSGE